MTFGCIYSNDKNQVQYYKGGYLSLNFLQLPYILYKEEEKHQELLTYLLLFIFAGNHG